MKKETVDFEKNQEMNRGREDTFSYENERMCEWVLWSSIL